MRVLVPHLHCAEAVVSRILHVEDDPSLRAIVDLSFRGFGFRGELVGADSVAEAERLLDDAARSDSGRFDLIISDMHLPDGSGLDVVRHVRAAPAWRSTPVLILSSDVDPKRVGRAYALGANAYVDKSPRARTLRDVVKSLYLHWTKDVLVPSAGTPSRLQALLARAIVLRARYARIYQRFAEDIAANASESAFWLSRALAESNLVNLLRFLANRIDDQDLPPKILEGMERMQEGNARLLTDVEQRMDDKPFTHEEACTAALELLPGDDLDLLCRTIAHLFPVVPTAMEALRELLIGTIDDVTRWIQLHGKDADLRDRAVRARADGDAFSEKTESFQQRGQVMID